MAHGHLMAGSTWLLRGLCGGYRTHEREGATVGDSGRKCVVVFQEVHCASWGIFFFFFFFFLLESESSTLHTLFML